MNCDQTINVLLDGEISADQSFQEHLAECKRCQAMVDILQPLRASQVQPATVSPASFPFDQTPSQEAVEIAQVSARRLDRSSSVKRKSIVKLKYVAAFCAGVVATLGGIAVIRSEPALSSGVPQTACLWESDYNASGTQEDFVKSCVACHLPAH